ncbi:MAG TPA: 5-guanidino-2-oxopentanoate decarboxylase [Thermoleophilaceae bacterium]|jgi:acetolactate synthase-1/2/3 large subunit|nr:5-guanidino-2-oxopentanoate decarboxylase [Thermoleophilaceae bacterium]
MRVGEAIAERLKELGVDTVFGIPGVHTIELYRGIDRAGLRAITARHEQGAGFMADGYARVTGQPGVCVLITGPGVTNALTPVAQAYHDSVPLLVLASTTARRDLGRARGPLHDLPDQAELARGVTAFSETVLDPEDALSALDRAWTAILAGRPRPAHLAVPVDVLGEECDAPRGRASSKHSAAPEPAQVQAAADLLARSECPVILLGGGAVDVGEVAVELATLLDAPTALTGNAKGAFPASHPLCLGATLPFDSVQELLADADVALLVGTELSEVDVIYSGSPLRFGGAIVRVDVDPAQVSNGVAADAPVVGDAPASLQALLAALRERGAADRQHAAAQRVRGALAGITWTPESKLHMPWLDALDAALPADRIVVLDSTKLAYTAHHYLDAERPRAWLAPYGYGTLGPALPMAIGAKLGAPKRSVVAIAGDGGLLFTIAELATAVDLQLPIPLVVWDNRGYDEIRDSFDRARAPRIGTETTAHDLCAIAEGFGCHAALAHDPDALRAAVVAAFEADRPTLVRVPASD